MEKDVREIGGFLEYEHYHGDMLHDNAVMLNSGRNCLAYLIRVKSIKKILIPFFICTCIEDTCIREGVTVRYYNIDYRFLPQNLSVETDEWLYLVNYYGQLSKDTIIEFKAKYKNLILDNAHAYFFEKISGIDTLYTCRKFFGVPDVM